jgi:hypothetical protein
MVRVQTNCSFYRNDGKGAGSFSVGLRLFLISMILLGMSHSISAGCAQAVDYVDLSYRLCSRIRCHQFIKRLNKRWTASENSAPPFASSASSPFSPPPLRVLVLKLHAGTTGLTVCLPSVARVTYTSPEVLCAAPCERIRQRSGGRLRRSTVKGVWSCRCVPPRLWLYVPWSSLWFVESWMSRRSSEAVAFTPNSTSRLFIGKYCSIQNDSLLKWLFVIILYRGCWFVVWSSCILELGCWSCERLMPLCRFHSWS